MGQMLDLNPLCVRQHVKTKRPAAVVDSLPIIRGKCAAATSQICRQHSLWCFLSPSFSQGRKATPHYGVRERIAQYLETIEIPRFPNSPQVTLQNASILQNQNFEINQSFTKIRNCSLWSKIVCSPRNGLTHAPADRAQVTAQLEARVRPK